MGRPPNPETTPTKKLVLTLTDDGESINWDRLRVSTREQFISALKQSQEVMSALDRPTERQEASGSAVSAADPAFTQETVRVALDLLGTINAFALRLGVAKMVKHPFKADENGRKLPFTIDADIAAKAFQLNDAQHAELDPRLEKKLNELKLPGFLEKNLDWYLIGATYLKYCGENAKVAMGTQLARDLQVRGREEFLKNAAAVKNPKPDSDAVPRHMNGDARNTPQEFVTEEETFPPLDRPQA